MTVKEIAISVGKDTSTVQRWVKKMAGKMQSIDGKMQSIKYVTFPQNRGKDK